MVLLMPDANGMLLSAYGEKYKYFLTEGKVSYFDDIYNIWLKERSASLSIYLNQVKDDLADFKSYLKSNEMDVVDVSEVLGPLTPETVFYQDQHHLTPMAQKKVAEFILEKIRNNP